jgi:hypothetical protein
MHAKLEYLGIGLILGPVAPLVGLLGMWWVAYLLLPEKWIFLGALSGLLFGIFVDLLYLKHQINTAHRLDSKLWGAIYLFYSICVFGFFMGVPVFNLGLALPTGFIIGARLASHNAVPARVKTVARQTAFFTTIIMFGICLASALLALTDPYTAANLEGMLGLCFQLTQTMIVGIILVGGLMLLILQWCLIIITIQKTFKFMKVPDTFTVTG